MDNKQFLTNDQIHTILSIVMRDHVTTQVDDAIKLELESNEFKNKLEEIKNSKENLELVKKAKVDYENNLKAFDLFQQIKSIDKDLVTNTDWDDNTTNISWLVDTTKEVIEENYKIKLDSINNSCESQAIIELKIQSSYGIKDSIREDLKARLQLTVPGTYDEIIDDIKTHINIPKYLHYS
jgi:hypothetical protein